MSKEISDKMANRLWTARHKNNLTLGQVARKTGVSRTQLNRFFGEGRRNVSDTTYQKLWRFAYYDE
ncbi:unnamed protein product [Fructobacillus tropaeoli]|uniref:helix-turn-helix domain-containing protein n=1 Tax=Fructobacillus tropaeoli TaxID=709323 RepID=UPI002D9CF045|nr:unnamed protein product [Fructobacillus tropaeoli]